MIRITKMTLSFMDIVDAMDVQNWISFIHNYVVDKYIFRKRSKLFTANEHISFILQSIERRDLITICFEPPSGVEVRWDDLSTLLEKKIESKIP